MMRFFTFLQEKLLFLLECEFFHPGMLFIQRIPNIAELSFEDRFGLLVDKEWMTRKNNHLTRLIKSTDHTSCKLQLHF